MNKKLYLLIIWLVTLGVIVFAGYKSVHNFKDNHFFGININKGNHYDSDWDDYDYDFDDDDDDDDNFHFSGNSYIIDKDLDAFNKIDIQGNVMGVTVKPGTNYSIYCNFTSEKLLPKVEVSNNTLHITQHGSKNTSNNHKSTVEITVPANVFITDINADVNVGAFEIKDLKTDKVKIANNVGAISIKNTDFNNADLKSNVGAIEMKLKGKKSDYNWDITTSIGGISIMNKNYHRTFKENNHASKSIKAESNVGAVEVK